ncbi:hypothetical protein JCM11491_007243 [Sporobolomyces phaffii]
MTQPRPSRPTTPLRRISSHSLRSLSLSHSQSRADGGAGGPPGSSSSSALAHLAPVFSELSDSIADLCANAHALADVATHLDRFNEGFASYLYGLRINSYTFDFKHPPNKINFDLASERRILAQEQQQLQLLRDQQQRADDDSRSHSPFGGDRTILAGEGAGAGAGAEDTTFVTNDEHSFIHPTTTSRSTSANSGGARGRGGAASGIARGGGARGGGAGARPAMTKRRKEEISAFADPVFPLLPINLRENRRNEVEKVLWALKEHPNGLGLTDLTKHLSTSTPPIPQVRINEVLLAFVRAKVATKGLVKGVNLYRLDENRIA